MPVLRKAECSYDIRSHHSQRTEWSGQLGKPGLLLPHLQQGKRESCSGAGGNEANAAPQKTYQNPLHQTVCEAGAVILAALPLYGTNADRSACLKKKRVLSGIQPSGNLHIGNYFGMMKPMIDLQVENELFCFLPNYHALTSQTDGEVLRKNTVEAAADFLSLGMDPEKSVFWVQSDVPEVTELTWVLNNVTSVGMLERATSYKDKVSQGLPAHHGLFSYPVLMTADILLFGTEVVPVGKDQKQHLEMARDIAIKFNTIYGETFVVPEALIAEETGLIPGTDGQKMSKSYGNTLEIFCEKNDLAEKVMGIVTDNTPPDEPKETENNTLFMIYSLFLEESERNSLKERFQTPGLKYVDVKKELVDVIWDFFAAYREKRNGLYADDTTVVKILKEGADKARDAAEPYLKMVRERTGILYWDS